ncbi:MAG: methyltransferase domain-containing protein [Pseudonocardiaceae bacterium]|nr:methyltransferase domain-containing protein [Pseudonocardiaceae bacterium]
MPSRPATQHPLFARFFERVGARNEQRGQAGLRAELLAGLRGLVLEVGAGNGLNFPHYPVEVDEVLVVEPEPYLRERAGLAAERVAVRIAVFAGTADALPVANASVDVVVCSGVLCSVPDVPAALAEFRRVLRPAGEFRFYEHVRAGSRVRAAEQLVLNTVWPRLMGGCQLRRRTGAAIEAAGFTVRSSRELIFPAGAKFSPVAPRILGAARSG